jgi:hypothetical protein
MFIHDLELINQRVFKYASKGYGIRILPNYLEALKNYKRPPSTKKDDTKEEGSEGEESPKAADIEYHMTRAKRYFDRLFATYMRWSKGGEGLVYRIPWASAHTQPLPRKDKPFFTHALLDTAGQNSSEPQRRSCLSGFELFYRHICLWKAEQEGKLQIYDSVWASTTVCFPTNVIIAA